MSCWPLGVASAWSCLEPSLEEEKSSRRLELFQNLRLIAPHDSCSPGVPKEFNVEAIAIAVTIALAELHQSFVMSANRSDRSSFGHEQNFYRGNPSVHLVQ